MDIGESFRPQDGSLDYEYQNNHYSLRLSTLPVRSSESLTIRILPQTKRYTLNELCLFPFQTKEISKLLNFTSGLIVFSGSTGSGKTTLMDSLIEELRSEEHTSELQSRGHLVCRLLLEKKKKK